eukprot:7819791-Alexandrium_andersonii.AAC.1
MSASLVGSEMCIRDRGRAWCGNASRGFVDVRSDIDGGRQSPTGRSQPVSYTHLTLPTICSV